MAAQPKLETYRIAKEDSQSISNNRAAKFESYASYSMCRVQVSTEESIKQEEDDRVAEMKEQLISHTLPTDQISFHTNKATSSTMKEDNSIEAFSKIRSKHLNIALKLQAKRTSKAIKEQVKADVISTDGYILTKSMFCKEQPFYCGNCHTTFAYPKDFANHCLRQCQLLAHRNSSHFIEVNQQKVNNVPALTKSFPADGKQFKQKNEGKFKQDQSSAVLVQRLSHSSEIAQGFNTQPIKEIIRKRLDHSNRPFYCGTCHKNFTQKKFFYYDIFRNHQKIIQPSSSHIILQCRFKSGKTALLYLSPSIQWIHSEPKYSCPCLLHINVPMASLIQHVIDAHNGVSPRYQLSKQQQTNFSLRAAIKGQEPQQEPSDTLFQENSQEGYGEKKKKVTFNSRKGLSTKEYSFHFPRSKNFSMKKGQEVGPHEQNKVISEQDNQYLQQIHNIFSYKLDHSYQSLFPQKDNQVIPQKQHIDDMEPIKEIIKNNMDHSYLPFYCVLCEKSFNLKFGYFNHVSKTHKGFVQPSNSHIILQCIRSNNTKAIIYLSTTQNWANSDPKYFCPCKPETKITMKQLIQHVMKEHQGISPCYLINKNIGSKPKQLNQKALSYTQDKNQQISEKKKDNPFQLMQQEQLNYDINQSFQSIKQIYYYQLDHRNLSPYCGICQRYFFQGPQYWQHIMLTHNSRIDPSSSHIVLHIHDRYRKHYLYLTSKVKWIHDEKLYYCPCNKRQKMAMSSLITHVFENHYGVSPIYHQENDNMNYMHALKDKIKYCQKDPILFIKSYNLDHKNTPFECKLCQQTLKKTSYRYHIKYTHNNIIDPTSSHVILRIKFANKENLYISPHIEWPMKESIYYCPCSPQLKMTMELLIRHMFDQHRGISPIYYYYQQTDQPNFRQPIKEEEKKVCNPSKQETIKPNSKTQVDPFINIVHDSIDNTKLITFDCNSCKKAFDSNSSYINHLLDVNHSQQNPIQSCSHVIFRTSSSSERKTLYISPRIEWQDKRKIYYCPCQPDNKTTMKELLQHHITAHNFITPTYELSPIDEA